MTRKTANHSESQNKSKNHNERSPMGTNHNEVYGSLANRRFRPLSHLSCFLAQKKISHHPCRSKMNVAYHRIRAGEHYGARQIRQNPAIRAF
jgi:hypothetical protein